MNTKEIYDLLKAKFNGKVLAYNEPPKDAFIVVDAKSLPEITTFLKDDGQLLMDSLVCLSGVDYPDRFSVAYHLFSTKKLHKTVIKVNTDRENPSVPTVSNVWPGAVSYERETFDLFGIIFYGHPNLERLLMPDDWEGYPLRKDYKFPAFYHGINAAGRSPGTHRIVNRDNYA
ncbi:MAG: NADH-quinone oxidoreductase subunit C [Planctomycetes bacterium]|nr:NADH-quinone oxidoreductase subunit C [Planctomycetota bacterium]